MNWKLKEFNKKKFDKLKKRMLEAKFALEEVQRSMLNVGGDAGLVEEEKRVASKFYY